MCGPADFDALHICVTRLAELSAAGVTGYSVYKTASFWRKVHPKREEREEGALENMPGRLVVEGSSGHPNT